MKVYNYFYLNDLYYRTPPNYASYALHTLHPTSATTAGTASSAVAILAQTLSGCCASGGLRQAMSQAEGSVSAIGKVRPRTSHFSAFQLAADLAPLAQLRNPPGFQWDGSHYTATRYCTHDIGGLVTAHKPLEIILKAAPTGFPSHGDLKDALIILHTDKKVGPIFDENLSESQLDQVGADSADRWRIQTKHVYEAKKSGVVPAAIEKLAQLIVLPVPSSSTPVRRSASRVPATSAAVAEEELPEVAGKERSALEIGKHFANLLDLRSDTEEEVDGEADVSLIAVVCKCSKCVKPPQDTSTAVNIAVPSATKGRQRQDTEHRRLRIKTKTAQQNTAGGKGSKGKGSKGKSAKGKGKKGDGEKKKLLRRVDPDKLDRAIRLPVEVCKRNAGGEKPAEAYLLQPKLGSNHAGRFVISQSAAQTPFYLENIVQLKGLINDGEIHTIRAAKQWIIDTMGVDED